MGGLLQKRFWYFRFFEGYLKGKVYIMIVLNMLVGILDGLGLGMFLPLLHLAGEAPALNRDESGKWAGLAERLNSFGLHLGLSSVLLFIAVFFALKGAVYYVKGAYQVSTQQYFIKKIRLKAIKALGRFSYLHFTLADAGRMQNTLTTEIERVAKAGQAYFQAFQHLVLILVYVTFAFLLNWRFALMVCLGGVFIDFLYRKIYQQTKGVSRRLTDGNSIFQGAITEFITAYKYLKATGASGHYQEKLNAQVAEIESGNKKIGTMSVLLSASREPLSVLMLVALILLQVNLLNAPFATILVSLLFFYRALSALMQYQTAWNSFLSVSGSLENTAAMIADLENKQEASGKRNFEGLKEALVVENLSYSYQKKEVLRNLSFVVRKYEYIAIIGSSGSGKSTLANLIAGLLVPVQGTIRVDGTDLREIALEGYRKRIGYITQDPVIFNDNIYNNVTLWAEPSTENLLRFRQACEAAAIWTLASGELAGEIYGANGLKLSGGQKQRIAMARELFKSADLLIMDEATSAMDAFTEQEIQQSIRDLKGKVTLISIAHRLSTIKNADRVIFLDQGRMAQIGTFNALWSTNVAFKKIVELQTIGGMSESETETESETADSFKKDNR